MTAKKADWSPEERTELIKQMTHAKDVFYGLAARAGHHQFLEFAGLMHEYIKLCTEAHEAGHDFSSLPMQHHHAAYIAEKLECIYGPTLKRSPVLTRAFLVALFGTASPLHETAIGYRWDAHKEHWILVGREPSEQFPAIVRPTVLPAKSIVDRVFCMICGEVDEHVIHTMESVPSGRPCHAFVPKESLIEVDDPRIVMAERDELRAKLCIIEAENAALSAANARLSTNLR